MFQKIEICDRTLLKISNHRKSEKKFLDGLARQVVFASKKKSELDLVQKNTIEKNNQKKKAKQKQTIEPKKFYRER